LLLLLLLLLLLGCLQHHLTFLEFTLKGDIQLLLLLLLLQCNVTLYLLQLQQQGWLVTMQLCWLLLCR
jgi:hypothetical protein